MASHKLFAKPIITWVGMSSLTILLGAGLLTAQNSSGNYVILVGAGFLCDLGDSSACPAVVKSAEGSSYELAGVGTLNMQSRSVTATGTFTRKSANGNSLETGIWIANELVGFDSYGIAPGARLQAGPAFGPPQFGPRRMPMLSGSMPAGGLAVIRIRLLPMWGPSRTAVLQVNCALGKVPEEHPREGIRLTFERGSGEFDEEISGRTMFVVTRLGASPVPKQPTTGEETNTPPAQAQQ